VFDQIDWQEAQCHNHHYGYDVDEFKIYSFIRHITFGSNYYIIQFVLNITIINCVRSCTAYLSSTFDRGLLGILDQRSNTSPDWSVLLTK
jgi:hypothetical protein